MGALIGDDCRGCPGTAIAAAAADECLDSREPEMVQNVREILARHLLTITIRKYTAPLLDRQSLTLLSRKHYIGNKNDAHTHALATVFTPKCRLPMKTLHSPCIGTISIEYGKGFILQECKMQTRAERHVWLRMGSRLRLLLRLCLRSLSRLASL